MINPEGKGLVFILTTPRSGSTLLGAILGSHSQVACPPEPWILLPLLGMLNQHHEVVAPYDHALARLAAREFVDESLYREASVAFALSIYNRQLERAGKRIFVDKGTRYYQVAERLREMFPQAVYIWLRRNPLDVIASYKNTWEISVSELFGPIVSPNSFDIAASFDILLNHYKRANRKHVVKYEDLVDAPQEVVRELCSTLEIDFEEGMLSYLRNDRLMSAYRASQFGDRKIHRAESIHQGSVGAWRNVLTVDEVKLSLDVLGSEPFSVMGYDDVLREALAVSGTEQVELTSGGRRARVCGRID